MFGALLGLAGSLFGARSAKKQTAAQNVNNLEMQEIQNAYNTEAALLERANSLEDIDQSMVRARAAAENAGYNPLTAMGFAGANASPSSAVGARGAVAKLASPSIIGNLVSGVADVVTSIEAQDAQEKRATDQLKRVAGEKNLSRTPKAASIYAKTKKASATSAIPKAAGVATLGAKAANPQDNEFTPAPVSLAPGRNVEAIDVANTSGVFAINNRFTGNEDIIIPGDSEPWGIDELATAAIVGGPQLLYRAAGNAYEEVDNWRHTRKFNKLHKQQTEDDNYRKAYKLHQRQNNNVQ